MCILKKPKYLIGNDVRKHFGGIVFISSSEEIYNFGLSGGFEFYRAVLSLELL